MTPFRCAAVCLIAAALAVHSAARAEPAKASLSTTERPQAGVVTKPPLKLGNFGLCDFPQNAHAFPSSPVPVVAEQCADVQTFVATSAKPITGAYCGGFLVAFGPMGDLKPYLDDIALQADWGDEPPNEANCASATVAAAAWGARCTNKLCTTGEWEKIGATFHTKGTWNAISKTCYLGFSFTSSKKQFRTLNLEIVATQVENGQTVRKRAKGTIIAQRGNGQCFGAKVPPLKRKQSSD